MAMDRERPRGRKRRKVCTFCVDKVEHIDYKDAVKLRRFLSCSMTIYGVAEEKQQQVIDRVLEMDLKSVADQLVADAIHQADEQYQEAERKGKAIEAARNG